MTRAFIAVALPADVLDAVSARVAALAVPGGRMSTREQWHVTVQFLGDDADIDAVVAAFARRPLDLGEGELQLGGALVFGRARAARILAFGLHAGAEWMRALATGVDERLAPLGFVRDSGQEFRPHLTIARFRAPTDLRALRTSLGPEPVGAMWTVEEVVLFESVLDPRGARHVFRAAFPVGPRMVLEGP